jgi:hypothetical protein
MQLATTWGSPQFSGWGPAGRETGTAAMKVVYCAANPIDAHLVRHALEDAGLPAFVLGESLAGGVGELPLHGLIRVCVPEAAWPEADAIVQSLGLGVGPADPVGDDAIDPGFLPA